MRAVPLLIAAILISLSRTLLPAQELPFQQYTLHDGLAGNRVMAVFQDKRGFLWFGTDNGVSRYDGNSFTNFTTADGLTNSYITAFENCHRAEDAVWIGTLDGLNLFEHGLIRPYKFNSPSPPQQVAALYEDGRGTLWCGTSDGIWLIRDDSTWVFPSFPRQLDPQAVGIIGGPDSTIIVGFEDTLYVISPGYSISSKVSLSASKDVHVQALLCTRDGTLWAGMSDSTMLAVLDGRVRSSLRIAAGTPMSLDEDADGHIWIGTLNGLCRVHLKQAPPLIEYLGVQNNLPEPYTPALFIDRENVLWIGTYSAGAVKLASRNFVRYPIAELMDTGGISRTLGDSQDHLWIFARGQGVWEMFKNAKGQWRHERHPELSSPQTVPEDLLMVDRFDRLWCSGSGSQALKCFRIVRKEGKRSVLEPQWVPRRGRELPDSRILSIAIDSLDRAWLGFEPAAVGLFDLHSRKMIRLFTSADGVPAGSVVSRILVDRTGNVWIGRWDTGLGLLRSDSIASGGFRALTTRNGLPDDRVRALFQDDRGTIWVGTRFGGIVSWNGASFDTLQHRNLLLSQSIRSIFEDSQRRLWVTTDIGLECIDLTTRTPQPANRSLIGETIVGAGTIDSEVMWFATLYHVSMYVRPTGGYVPAPPPIHILALRTPTDRDLLSQGGNIETNETDIVIEYVGLSFADEHAVRYEYAFLGPDDRWKQTSERTLQFASLKPGDYTFAVRAINADGLRSFQPATVSFTVLEPVWERWWFLTGSGMGAGLLVFVVLRQRFVKLRKAKHLQEEFSRRLIDSQEQERKRIAAELHDSLGQNLLIIKNKAIFGLEAAPDVEAMKDLLTDISDLSSRGVMEVRDISHNLHPYMLERLGLTKSLRALFLRVQDASDISLTFEIDDLDGYFTTDAQTNIYRIVQEGLNNILKHSGATAVEAAISRRVNTVSIRLRDNGKGLPQVKDVLSVVEAGGFGLTGIAERVRILGGTWSIAPGETGGTLLRVTVPLGRSSGLRQGSDA